MGMINFDVLESKLAVTRTGRSDADFSVNAADLLHKDNMDEFIRGYSSRIKALEPAAAAAGFCSWFRIVAVAQQYAVSVFDAALDLSLSNLAIQMYWKDGWNWVSFKLGEPRQFGFTQGTRERWREEVLTAFYREQVRPLIESIAASTGTNAGLLWGQFPSGFHYYIDQFLNEAENDTQRRQIEDDYQFLVRGLDGEVFGRTKNPFDVKIRLIDNPRDPGKPMRMKTTCCMFYRTEGGTLCYACPRMTDEEREARKAQMLAKARA